ncbi:FecR family protein [Devosia aquimaris]|uniref:FecR family protein n=1 Tax=Devosia aquimaris TaxID=2866214 RepID=UPI001CD12AF0|nr:FecR family protein [Devosia sp. CJK-A8-3]
MKLWFALLVLFASILPAAAADWTIERLRGSVVQQVNGSWRPVARGDVIPSNRIIRTGADGRAELRRNAETIALSADTQIRLGDAGDALMTTVYQDFGVVAVEAERRNVQHFSVQTPYLAAVVKGTRFVVRADERGATVDVQRGVVQVQDKENSLVTDIRPGQEATVGQDEPLSVSGSGNVAVYRFSGEPVIPGTTEDLPVADESTSVASPGRSNGAGKSENSAAADFTVEKSNNGNGRGSSGDNGNSVNASANANAGGNAVSVSVSPGNSGNSNAGGNGNGNSGGNGNGNSGNSNAGGNGNGNAGGNAHLSVDAGASVDVSVDLGLSGPVSNAGGNSNGAGRSEFSNAGGSVTGILNRNKDK